MGWNLRPRDLGGTQVMLLSINPSLLGYLNEFNTLSHAHSVPGTPNRPQFSTISEWIYDWSTCLSFLGLLKSSFISYMNDTWKNSVLMTWLSNQKIHTRTLTHTPHEAQLKPCFNATSIAAREAPLRGLHVSILDENWWEEGTNGSGKKKYTTKNGRNTKGKEYNTWAEWARTKTNSSTYRQIRLSKSCQFIFKTRNWSIFNHQIPRLQKLQKHQIGDAIMSTRNCPSPSCFHHSWDYHFSRTWWLCKGLSLLINQAWLLQGWCDLIIPKGTPR